MKMHTDDKGEGGVGAREGEVQTNVRSAGNQNGFFFVFVFLFFVCAFVVFYTFFVCLVICFFFLSGKLIDFRGDHCSHSISAPSPNAFNGISSVGLYLNVDRTLFLIVVEHTAGQERGEE